MIYMPTCQQVAREIASDELATASWRRRAAARIHLLMCRHCRRYARQMRAIGSAVQSLFQIRDEDAEVLERLEQTILEDNTEMNNAARRSSFRHYKTYRVYERSL